MNSLILKITAVCTAIIIAIVSVCSINVCALDQEFVRGGVVPIVFYVKDVYKVTMILETNQVISSEYVQNEARLGSGSGFFVGNSTDNPQYIVTNHHVIDYYASYIDEGNNYKQLVDYQTVVDKNGTKYTAIIYYEASSCEMRVYYSDDDYEKAYIECYGDKEKLDLAVLRLKEPTNKRHALKIAPVSNSNVSETVYTIGYPGIADNMLSSESRLGVTDSSVRKGTVSRIVTNEQGIERVSIDAAIQHGNSGGPLVNEDGYVWGVNTNSVHNSDNEIDYYSISSNDLMKFLDKNNIPYQKADDNTQDSIQDNTQDYTQNNTQDNIQVNTQGSTQGNSNTTLTIVIIAVGVVILAAVAVVLKSKGSMLGNSAAPAAYAKPSAPAVPNAPSQQAVSTKKAVIRSMSAQHNGKTFPVGKAPVVIGRDPSKCVIIFKEGTKGVSGVHCSVSYDSDTDMFTITDLGSTYGTYLIGGQQVLAKTSLNLRSGDSFYVGDKSNVCRVEVVK